MAATNPSCNDTSDPAVVWALVRRLFALGPGVRRDLLWGLFLEGVAVALGVIGPFALKSLIDALSRSPGASSLVLGLGLVFVGAWAGGGILSTWRLVPSTRVIDTLSADLAAAALAGELPRVAASRDGDSGRTLGLIERLPFSLLIVVDGLIWRSLPLALQIAASLWVIAGVIPASYAIGLFLTLAGYAVLSWWGAVRHRPHASLANLAATAVSQGLGDVLRNARRIVLNGTLSAEVGGIRAGIGQKALANQKMTGSLVHTALAQYGWLGMGLVGLLVAGAGDVWAGRLSVGDFIMLETYALRLALPLSGIGFLLSQSAGAIANIRDVLTLRRSGAGTVEAGPVPSGAAGIELRDVSFRYADTTAGVEDVSVRIPAGAFAVIVGPNGSGKSTLAQIMAGVFAPSQGQVRIGEVDLAEVDAGARYRHVLYVPQFITFLNRTLRDNALYPPTTTTEADLVALLAQWCFYEAGRKLDLATPVGELGERLSGGQIQKLELARVAGIKVPVLILDESTSALDPASEARILSDLRQSFEGRTTLVMVTHRLRLAQTADHVLFMKGGRLEAFGRHLDLVESVPAYAQLWAQGAE
ncbi:ABC transporter ATP-binding protein [Asticcacaulis sp. DXS10W]|uniref:ABC transporter ATP-binding protein n=1 Tax=Asticcacaulis currens TaxID=2984210 RepID=A0ABT5IBG9_9CAUL|nr:ABC transporter ATP-binding protein [Asticcacaulis currens]MDC7693526.1 ABC transporter ATP-binding protein [Asticcacaulis currens]